MKKKKRDERKWKYRKSMRKIKRMINEEKERDERKWKI